MQTFRIIGRIVVTVLLVGAIASCQSPTKDKEISVPDFDKRKLSKNLACAASCSQSKLRTGNIRLSWDAPAKLAVDQRMEMTVFKNGFSTGAFASFPTHLNKQAMAPLTVNRPELRKLRAFEVRLQEVKLTKARDAKSFVVVEGVEPGVNYHWRVMTRTKKGWTSNQTVVCAAPICPADMIEEK